MDFTALLITGKLALAVTPLLLALCMPLAYWLAMSRAPGKRFVEAACNLPMVLPPTVLGFGLLMVMSPASPFGAAWEALFGSPLPFSFSGLVLGSLAYSLPFGVLPMRAAFEKIDPGIVEAARCSGMTHVQAFRHVILPNAMGGVTASAALIFAHTVGEFGVALMLGGSIPGRTKVASIAIFEHTESLEYGQAGMLSLALLVVSYATLLFIGRHGLAGRPAPARTPADVRSRRRAFQDTQRGFHADHIHAVR
ncbi:molybdate ABC transporter, inner membrane subunit [Pseudodesulfovibrio mercurii]|uniref:Molybdenum transport system permease n=1 Tax=Pseudodesulfovibrio mercurii TaxID=641491 RepID=F0JD18_9BACT|nr:molybdate ABC transporter permease subunit [Pseudodesulfovibrio mercurii]EGB14510.1 molybdate ABC transporter, inner membrane subunit [Pseudodesulfovibrio mercurii]